MTIPFSAEGLKEFVDKGGEIPESLRQNLASVAEVFRKLPEIGKSLSPLLQSLKEWAEALPVKTRESLEVLAMKGWYVDFEMPASWPFKLSEALKTGDADQAQAFLTTYYRQRAEGLIEEICGLFPDRCNVLRKALAAHRQNDYELSIPVFLAQADGICAELTGIQLYSREQGQPKTNRYVRDMIVDTFELSFFHPFVVATPISATAKERTPSFHELNRHQVLHGEKSDYGTEENSLKTISLLSYTCKALKRLPGAGRP